MLIDITFLYDIHERSTIFERVIVGPRGVIRVIRTGMSGRRERHVIRLGKK